MSWFSTPSRGPIIATGSIYARTECPECGSSIIVQNLCVELSCKACRSRIPVPREFWTGLFFRFYGVVKSRNGVSMSINSAISSELPIYARFRQEHPICIQCSSPLDLKARPLGSEGPVPCTGCAFQTASYPAPPWLQQEFPDMQQFYVPIYPPVAPQTRAVSFACPECGGNLRLTDDSPRLVDCRFCKNTLFLPPELWHAMHPIQKRTPWWVATLQ